MRLQISSPNTAIVQTKTVHKRIPLTAAGLLSLFSGVYLLIFGSSSPVLNEPCLIIASTGKKVCAQSFNYPVIFTGIFLTIVGTSIVTPFVISQVMKSRRHGVLSPKNEKRIMVVSALAVVAFLLFVPVYYTTIPPPTYHPSCHGCIPYIATHVSGSITYRFFGIGGIIPGDWGNWQYYSFYYG